MESKFGKPYFFVATFFAFLFFWLNIFGVIDLTQAFTNPTGNPPTGSGGSFLSGSGATDYITKFTNSSVVGNSIISENIGNIGINTTSPGAKLEIYDSVNDNILKLRRDAINATTFRVGADGAFVLQNNATDAVGIKNGNVGIGKANPGYKLDVLGDILAAGWLRTSGNAGWYSETYGGGWFMTDVTWLRAYGSKNVWTDSLLGSAGGLTVGYSGATPPLPAGGAIISGNVGIGTSIPGAKLDVAGTVKATGLNIPTGAGTGKVLTSDVSGVATWQTPAAVGLGGGGTTNYMSKFTSASAVGNSQIFDDATNVGIGTTIPGAKLDVVGTVKATGLSIPTGAGAGKVLTSDAAGAGTWQTSAAGLGGGGTTNYMSKFTSASVVGNSQIFDNGTNVGIGTALPSTQLHTTGIGRFDGGVQVDGITIIADNAGWHYTQESTGWYNNTYGGGIWMQNSSDVEIYGGKNFKIPNGKLLPNYDSGWFSEQATTNHKTVLTHNLGLDSFTGVMTGPSRVEMWFTQYNNVAPASPIIPMVVAGTPGISYGSPESVRINSNTIELSFYSGDLLARFWDGSTGVNTEYESGFMRVMIWR